MRSSWPYWARQVLPVIHRSCIPIGDAIIPYTTDSKTKPLLFSFHNRPWGLMIFYTSTLWIRQSQTRCSRPWEELHALGALDNEGFLTRLGREIADLPMEPPLVKVLVIDCELGCSDEMLSIAAMLSLLPIFYRPKEKQMQANQKKAKFHDPSSDDLMLLNVYNA